MIVLLFFCILYFFKTKHEFPIFARHLIFNRILVYNLIFGLFGLYFLVDFIMSGYFLTPLKPVSIYSILLVLFFLIKIRIKRINEN